MALKWTGLKKDKKQYAKPVTEEFKSNVKKSTAKVKKVVKKFLKGHYNYSRMGNLKQHD